LLRVLSYEDEANGVMTWDGGTYRFGEVVLRPRVVIEEGGRPDVGRRVAPQGARPLLHCTLGELPGAARARGVRGCRCDFVMA
jgi:hypothetical protein